MKFMLMMHAPGGKGDWAVLDWPPQDLKAHIGFMIQFSKELHEAGELVGAEGLAGPEQARIVRAEEGRLAGGDRRAVRGDQGVPRGLLDRRLRDARERAYEIAARASAAPGKGGAPLNMPIEVRAGHERAARRRCA